MEHDRPSRLLIGFIVALGLTVVGLLIALVVAVSADRADEGVARPTTSSSSSSSTPTTAPADTTSVTSTTNPETTTAATSSPGFDGNTAAERADGEPFATFALLGDVRFADREGFTRIVFDFLGDEVPWWAIEYVAGPDFRGSEGTVVTVEGDAFLRVTLSASGTDRSGETAVEVYRGADRIPIGTVPVTEIVRIDDTDGVVEWVIGVEGGERPFRVGTLLDPVRIYIDIGT